LDGSFSSQPHDDNAATDHLADSVLRSLGRSFRNQFSLSPAKATAMGLITFGLWPFWQLSRQFADYVTFERQQFWHLAEWLRVRRGGDEAIALHEAVKNLKRSRALKTVASLGIALFIMAVCSELNGRFSIHSLIGATYHGRQVRSMSYHVWPAWVVGLSVAYLCHVGQIALHHYRLKQFAERFNKVAEREGVAPIASPTPSKNVDLKWIMPAALFTWLGAGWGLPMALAGVLQRGYINETATHFRAALLDRARAMIQQQRPAVAVPSYVIHGRRCDNPLCRTALKAGARFCSRCGASAGLISEVA
jgi:hypothetical protein